MDMQLYSGEVECPICGAIIILDNVMMHEIVYCEHCAAEFEIVGVAPFVLEEVYDEEDYGE